MIRAVSLAIALVCGATAVAAAADQSLPNTSREELTLSLAESLVASRAFAKAEQICAAALAAEPENAAFQTLLADIYAAEHKYAASIALYDQVLAKHDDVRWSVKRARILGWAKRYRASLAAYRSMLHARYDPLIELEMLAKRFYWNHWVLRAIEAHERLLRHDPENSEALFHLTQLYAHEGMWVDARRAFEGLRAQDPNDPRAVAGLEEVRRRAQRPFWKSTYEFFEADGGTGRDMDIRRWSLANTWRVPLQPGLHAALGHRFIDRSFRDHNSVDEEEVSGAISYRRSPALWWQGSYAHSEVSSNVPSFDAFGAAAGSRLWDLAACALSFHRERLENSSDMLVKGRYADQYLGRLDWDLAQRVKLGMDYLYARYSDDNVKHEPGADLLYYVSYEPSRLYLKYRVLYRNFDHITPDYFSPKRFWVHQWRADWRHYIGTPDVYFGGKERYVGCAYDVSLDSQHIVSHRLAAELRWELAHSMTVALEAFFSHASATVYRDQGLTVSLDYSF